LEDAEIVLFWSAAEKLNAPFGAMCKLLLLTGARLREVAGMRRAELSADGATWLVPGTRTKNGKPLNVPLPPLAREILASVQQVAGKPGYVFTTTGTTPVSGFSKTKRRLDELMAEAAAETDEEEIPAWRLHDLRRTCATGMANIGVPPHIVEACINHISGAKAGVAGVYNRAEYGPEKKAALERWANYVAELVSGERTATLVPFRRP
jgi:integrase